MDVELDKKLKKALKMTKKPAKSAKKSAIKVSIGKYVGRRGKFKLYKVSPKKVIAIRTKRVIRGGAIEEEDIHDEDYFGDIFNLEDLDDDEGIPLDDVKIMEEEVKAHEIPEEVTKPSEVVETRFVTRPSEVVEVKPIKKRVPSAKQKKWTDYVNYVAKLPEMKGKSRGFVMQEASRRKKCKENLKDDSFNYA